DVCSSDLLYTLGAALGALTTLTLAAVNVLRPEMFLEGWPYPLALGLLLALGIVSFPIKILALLDTRRRAASPLINQQTTVLLVGIVLGLGCYLALRSEEHTSELQSRGHLVCRLLLEKKKVTEDSL